MPIVGVATPGDLRRFVRLAEDIYADNLTWVPPQRRDLTRLLTGRSPLSCGIKAYGCLFEQADTVVARAAAFVNDRYVEAHGQPVGFVGLFEAQPHHPEAARAILVAASDWLARQGMEAAIGPINGHALYGFALPVDHCDELPIFPYGSGQPFYPQVFREAGFEAAYPELTYLIDLRPLEPSALAARRRAGTLRIRAGANQTFREDCEAMTRIINDAFRGKWYFAPLPLAESVAFWRENRQGIVPRLFLIAERDGEAAGCLVSFPDYSPALRAMGGGSGPIALGRFLWQRRRIRQGVDLHRRGCTAAPRRRHRQRTHCVRAAGDEDDGLHPMLLSHRDRGQPPLSPDRRGIWRGRRAHIHGVQESPVRPPASPRAPCTRLLPRS